MLHQVFVLHAPSYECIHPENISANTLNMNNTQWQKIFLPVEFLATTHTMGPSLCNYYNYQSEDLEYIKENWIDIANNETTVTELQTRGESTKCSQWEYDTSEF